MVGQVRLRLLGGFGVEVEGRVLDESAFERRQAASLVKLLAIAGGRRLHREQVIDALWPDVSVDDAAPRLHKVASYVRSATGDKTAITLRDEIVLLWPGADVWIDVEQFEAAADSDPAAAADLYGGDLLPGDPYEDWAMEARQRLRMRHLDVLRSAGRWEAVLAVEPADEEAHLELMRSSAARGQRIATLRQFERLERALSDELGVSPSREAIELRLQALDGQPDRIELVGRTDERHTIQETLDQARQGSGSLLLLTGVAGIGKTTLSNWTVDRARQHGWIVGRAVAASIDGPWPYAPVLELIDDLLRHAPELLDELPTSHQAELRRVREAPDSLHDTPADDDGHQRLFVAVDRLVRNAARSRGLLLFVDDLHAADDASLSMFHYLARQATCERLVLLATARSGSVTPAFEALRSLLGRSGAREIRVGPLGPAESAEMIRAVVEQPLDVAQIDKIVALSGGTPFYVEEIAKALEAGAMAIPNHLASLVTASLSVIPSELRDALARVAIAGTRFDTDQFIALSGVDDADAFDLLDHALALEILEYSSGGYHFRHALLRDSLVEELAPHRRRAVHRDAATRFEAMGAPASRIAHHLIAADDLVRAAPWALQAARAAQAVGALSDAALMIDPVLDHADVHTRFELLSLRADVLAGMGDPGAVGAFQRALQEAEGPNRRVIRAKMARAAMLAGDVESASVILDGLEPDGGPFDGPVLFAKGMLAYMTGDLESAERAATEARKHALHESAPTSMLDVLTLQGMVAHNKGEWFERMRNELTATESSAELATTVFDCHL